jgi:signal transduction histidine kinase
MEPGGVADTERLRRLQALTDAALAHLQLDDLLAALLLRAREILEVDTVAVLLVDETTNELVVRAAVGIEEGVDAAARVPLGRGFAGRVAAERRPLIVDDLDRADVLNPLLREKGIRSMIGVPLVVGSRVLGVLHVGSLVQRSFRPDEVELLQLAGDRAAIAIEHARLYEAERSARLRIENVQALTDATLVHLELAELLDVLLPRIRTILATDTCAVLLLDEERAELVAQAALGIEEEVEQGIRVPVGRGFAGRVVAEGRPVVLDDLERADVVNPLLRGKGLRSMLGVPLLVAGRVIGVLHVGSLTQRRFTSEDTELLQLVAERVALAIARARLYEETMRLDELKLNFVAVASHELRTPATSVYGVLATLVGRGDDLSPELRGELLQVGYEQADRLRRLLDELLDLSRLDGGAISVDPVPLVLRDTLQEIAAGALVDPSDVRLEIPADLAAVADKTVIERVVTNLLVNAARYGTAPIVLAAERHEQQLRISVEDSGAGVPAELLPRLFERFVRGDGAPGSGLGLAIARAYARAHGGDLVYERRGRGACFELVIPQEPLSRSE